MKTPRRSLKWLLIAVVVGAVAVPTAVAAWPSSQLSCSSGSRLVHLGEQGKVEAAWDMCVSYGFRVATFEVPHHCMISTGAWISNFELEATHRRRPPKDFPRDGIAVRFALDPGISEAGGDSSLPRDLAELTSAPSGKRLRGVTLLEADVIQAEHLYHLSIWIGRNARPADQSAIEALVSSLRFIPGKEPEGAFKVISSSLP